MMDNKHLISEEKKTLICVLGWEDRFLKGFFENLSRYDIGFVLLIIYKDYFEKKEFSKVMNENLNSIQAKCLEKEILLEISDQYYSDAIINYSNIQILWESISRFNLKNAVIDITTIPREMIWNILTPCSEFLDTIELIYHKPQEYDSWLCRDFDKPLLQIGHSGISQFGKKTALVIITGFEVERTRQLINHFEPDIVVLCIQTGEQFENTKRNIECHQCFETPNLIQFAEIDSYNIEEGTNTLGEVIKELDNYNIILSSQGPKTSSVIVYNAFTKYPDVGLTYVPSRDININYSKGIADRVIYKFK